MTATAATVESTLRFSDMIYPFELSPLCLDGRQARREHLRTIAERGAVVLIATHDHDVQEACDNTLDFSASGASVLVQPPEHPRLIDASVG